MKFIFAVLLLVSSISVHGEQLQPRKPFILGYPSLHSIPQGDSVQLHISSSSNEFSLIIHRIAAKREKVFEKQSVPCSQQSIPDRASSDGCNWPATFELKINKAWKSGYYEATLSTPEGAKGKLFFVVRNARPAENSGILIQLAFNTYNAYTNWGGHSLYSYHDRDGLQGHSVSFDRPLRSDFDKWEKPFVSWAESNGYTLDYAINNDLEFHPEILKNYKLVLSLGHDEYWSTPMRDNLEKFIAEGGNVAFLSGNTCCWQIRNENNGRKQTCWKQWYNLDPHYRTTDHRKLSTLWSHHLIGRPENELTGVGFLWGGYHKSHGQFMDGSASFEVHRPKHWIFEGTKLKTGDHFGGKDTIVGYECDGCEMVWRDGLPYPTHNDGTPKNFTILATCPARWHPGDSYWYERFPKDRTGAAVLGTYSNNGTVVTVGTTDWAHGLRGKDPTVVQITHNILTKLSGKDKQASLHGPLDPRRSLASIQLNDPGLEVQLVASEPLVVDPVAFDWDKEGRLWVVEMRDYPKGLNWNKPDDPHGTPGGRIKILTDTDQDGRYDKSKIFMDNLVCPTGIKVWEDGALITAAPDILFARDTNGDDQADETEVWFTGFARSNEQHRVNGFSWGLDNWLHLANGDGGGKIRSTKTGKVIDIRGHDLRINPFTHEHELVSGQTQFGRFRDDWGNWFGCNNSNPLWHFPLDHKSLLRNQYVQAPKAAVSVPKIPGTAPVYPVSKTLKRFNQPDRANRFTSVCGPNFYRDSAMGKQYYGNVFICEPVHNLVNRQVLTKTGVTFSCNRTEEEQNSEFLASSDNWFRPVSVKTGPDGCLWISDMYRNVIEHPEWIPLDRQKKINLRAGSDKGRIYRIVPKGSKLPDLAMNEPLQEIQSPNGQRRDLAHQMLLWQESKVNNLQAIAKNHPDPKVVVHSLGVLHAKGNLDRATLSACLNHESSAVIRTAIRFADIQQIRDFANPRITNPIIAKELASSTDSGQTLAEILLLHPTDPYISATTLSSLNASNLKEFLSKIQLSTLQARTLQSLCEMAVAWNLNDSIDLLLSSVKGSENLESWKLPIMLGLARDPKSRQDLRLLVDRLTEKARKHPEAISLIGLLSDNPRDLTSLITPSVPPNLQEEVFEALGEQAASETASILLGLWSNFTPKNRKRATQLLLSRESWKVAFGNALRDEIIMPSQVDTATLNLLQHSKVSSTKRAQVVEAHQSVLQMKGIAKRGKIHFKQICSHCHMAEGLGKPIGPDIAAITDRSPASMLIAILDPNRAVEDKFLSYQVKTQSDQTHFGMIESESANHLTLCLPDGSRKILPRKQIKNLKSLGLSLMPDGLETALNPQQLADLLAYLSTLGKPEPSPPNLHSQMSARIHPQKDGTIELRAKKCRLSGDKISYMPKWDALGWWTSREDRAEWTIVLDHSGNYDVEWEWSVDPKHSGNSWQLLANGQKALTGKVQPTQSWEDFQKQNIGQVRLAAADTKIVLKPEGPLRENSALLDLRLIRFIPVKE